MQVTGICLPSNASDQSVPTVQPGQFCLYQISLHTELASSKLLGRVLLRLMGMCHWMGSHFHNWITFSKKFLGWGSIFLGFCGEKNFWKFFGKI